jgi:hypothetical protein
VLAPFAVDQAALLLHGAWKIQLPKIVAPGLVPATSSIALTAQVYPAEKPALLSALKHFGDDRSTVNDAKHLHRYVEVKATILRW